MGGELLLALPPTLVVLGAFVLVDVLRHERVLFAPLASSAFLIYREPAHPMNGVRPLVIGHVCGMAPGTLALITTLRAWGRGISAASSSAMRTI